MNKRNFFKGLVALLAMPGNIYAKVFQPKPDVFIIPVMHKHRMKPVYMFNEMENAFMVEKDNVRA
jgi:hypothetical protein